jgi:uncharacterized protein with PIN domain
MLLLPDCRIFPDAAQSREEQGGSDGYTHRTEHLNPLLCVCQSMRLQPSNRAIGKALHRKKDEEGKQEIAREYQAKIVAEGICESPHQEQAAQAYGPFGKGNSKRNKDNAGDPSA